jgi:SAM-dependent methyltransferase
VLEVGAGPGQIGAYLSARGVPVIVSDAAPSQVLEARVLDDGRGLLVADLARVPAARGSLAGIVAFYCLIFGPPDLLDDVFADWGAVLAPGGLVLLSVHAGSGTKTTREWRGCTLDIEVVLRDPDDLAERIRRAGLTVERVHTRPPYDGEQTDRCYVIARKP